MDKKRVGRITPPFLPPVFLRIYKMDIMKNDFRVKDGCIIIGRSDDNNKVIEQNTDDYTGKFDHFVMKNYKWKNWLLCANCNITNEYVEKIGKLNLCPDCLQKRK